MARVQDWQHEVRDGLRRENWSLKGPNRIVKVLPLSAGTPSGLGGYITTGSSLLGKTPEQIQHALGLKARYLANGAAIYRFTRLPLTHEYEYELTAYYPDGLAFNPAHGESLILQAAARSTNGVSRMACGFRWIPIMCSNCTAARSFRMTGSPETRHG